VKKKITFVAFLMIAVSVAVFANAAGENKYPAKDIQFIVSSSAGGGTDAICRKIGQLAEKQLGGSFYMVNKPGVDDTVGPNFVMLSKPDGYTIGSITYGPIVQGVYQNVIAGFDTKKLDYIALITEEADALVVSAKSPYKTLNELIAAAKANPGQIPISENGIGNKTTLLLTMLENKYGVKFKHLSYPNSAPQRESILNGETIGGVSSLGDFAPLIQAGQARGLVEFSSVRNVAFPDVPTSIELGMEPVMLFSRSFVAVCAPKGMPPESIQALEAAFEKAVTSKEFIDWTTSIGVTQHFLKGEELRKYIDDCQTNNFKIMDDFKEQGLL
jgi:tripartite-type tricarboxylate transporter receptor subunit TctC